MATAVQSQRNECLEIIVAAEVFPIRCGCYNEFRGTNMDFIFKIEERILKSGKGAIVALALAFLLASAMVVIWSVLYSLG